MSRPPQSELPLTLLLFAATVLMTLIAAAACITDPLFRSMILLARQSDLLSQRYYGEVAPERMFDDAWRGMQQSLPFRVELVDEQNPSSGQPPQPRDWGLTLQPLDSTVKIVAVASQSPFAGLILPDDEITAVDDRHTDLYLTLGDYLRQRENTAVTFRIRREAREDSVVMVVPESRENAAPEIEFAGPIAYLPLNLIAGDFAEQISSESISTLTQSAAAILDLRNAQGGGPDNVRDWVNGLTNALAGKRVAVLVNSNTGGVAEELVHLLQDRIELRTFGTPTKGLRSRVEEIRLRGGQRLLVSVDRDGLEHSALDTAATGDSLATITPPDAVIPDQRCGEESLSPLLFALVHRGLLMDFVVGGRYTALPSVEEEAQLFADFTLFLNERRFRFEPLNDALTELGSHQVPAEMLPHFRNLRDAVNRVEPSQLEDQQDQIIRALLRMIQRIKIGGRAPLSARIRFEDRCLGAAVDYLQGSRQ